MLLETEQLRFGSSLTIVPEVSWKVDFKNGGWHLHWYRYKVDIIYTVCVIESRESLKRKPQGGTDPVESVWDMFDKISTVSKQVASYRYCRQNVWMIFGWCRVNWSSINIVVLHSRGDDVTEVTVNLWVIPVVTLWNGHITGELFASSSRHLSGTQSGTLISS